MNATRSFGGMGVHRWSALFVVSILFAACGSGGDEGDNGNGGNGNGGVSFTVNGKATFASVPHQTGGGLNYAATTDAFIRGATVQLLDPSGAVIATTTTDAQGQYSLQAASATVPVKIRVLAELKGSNFDFTVRDNTNESALYGMDSPAFSPAASATASQDMHAPSGWGGTSYSGERVAAPFAILDVAYLAKEMVSSVAPGITLSPLPIYWSSGNYPSDEGPHETHLGVIGTTHLGGFGIYVLGAENVDTDEYDTPVIARQLASYIQAVFWRNDAVDTELTRLRALKTSQHSVDELLDMRVAFSEGLLNAASSMIRDNPIYFDSHGPQQSGGFDFSVATAPSSTGWFSERTVQQLLWQDYQDPAIGYAGLHAAMNSLSSSPIFTSIFSFNSALRSARPAAASGITSRAVAAGVNGSDGYGTGESNDGSIASVLPVYHTNRLALGVWEQHCITSAAGVPDKLGNTVYLSFNASGTRTIRAGSDGAIDPAVYLLNIQILTSDGRFIENTARIIEISNVSLPSGTHVMAITDLALNTVNPTRCYNIRME